MICFYDIETTGISPENDQITQIAAAMTRDDLTPVAEFQADIRLGLDRIPHPGALLVSGLPISEFVRREAPSRVTVMREFAEWVERRPYHPAEPLTFIGWNSRRFDDPFLSHEFWRAIYSPFMTKRHNRHDAMRMVQLGTWLHGDGLMRVPLKGEGNKARPSYALTGITHENEFYHADAHSAGGDVTGLLNVCRWFRHRQAVEWERQLAFADPVFAANWVERNHVFMHAEFAFSRPDVRPAHLVKGGDGLMMAADLSKDPPGIPALKDRDPLPGRYLSLHAPLLLSYDETLAVPLADATRRAHAYDNGAGMDLILAWKQRKAKRDEREADKRPVHTGASLMTAPIDADARCDLDAWHDEGAAVAGKLHDPRLRLLSIRAAFENGEDLPDDMRAGVSEAIRRELLADAATGDGKGAPLSIQGAMDATEKAIAAAQNDDDRKRLDDYAAWLLARHDKVLAGDLSIP